MHFVRTILWLVLLIALVVLTMLNWETVLAMRIWPGFVWDTRLPAIVVVSFLLGLVPMWLFHRGSKWRLERRISHLESAARAQAAAVSAPAASPVPDRPVKPPANPADLPPPVEHPGHPEGRPL
ncbi:LapA family protein [Qipengyuania sediminis]|uniref:LapA family protein n=1 Tax=Qipengyuania sediminis TaxID=1532023 RepID=UPI00105AAF40|nr:LapA family protein [Qipengyuania sediminis]